MNENCATPKLKKTYQISIKEQLPKLIYNQANPGLSLKY